MVKMFFALPLEFEPGETWAYDNTGFILLGFIIEKASGKTYWDFLDERLFRPAGMTATRSTAVESLVPNRAAGYTWVKDHFENRPVLLPFIAFSAGSILSTAEDMAKWDVALTNGKIVKASSLEEMWTPTKLRDAAPAPFDYGFGWFLNEQRGHRIVEHTGGTPGFSCVFYRFPDDKLSVIILANHGDCVLDQLAIEIAGMYVPALKRPESATDPEPQLSSKLEQIFAGLLKGEHDNDAFTPAMQQFFATATGKSFWQWFAEHGELTSFTFSEREDRADARILRYRVRLNGNLYWLTAHLTKDGKIAQLYLW
ncbi:MAG: serine hydrolase domain-containing protein [Chthoniobacterales bacterium]